MRGIQQQRQQRCHQQSASGAAAAHRLTPHRCAAGPVACSSRARAALASPAAATATTTTAVETFVSREARAALFGSAEEVGRPCKAFCLQQLRAPQVLSMRASFYQSSLIPIHAAYKTIQSMGSLGAHSAVMPTATRFRVHPVVANPTPPCLPACSTSRLAAPP